MNTPWEILQGAITRLTDRVDGMPSLREATVTDDSPLAILFDTDAAPVLPYGTLVTGLAAGDRVLTLKLRHYIWVLGKRGGIAPYQLPNTVWNKRWQLGATEDWNSLVLAGDYRVASADTAPNAPGAGAYRWGNLTISSFDNGVTQMYVGHSTPAQFWFRLKYNASDWTPWQRLQNQLSPTEIYTVAGMKLVVSPDVGPLSASHALQIGPDGSQVMLFDGNEIASRNPDGTFADLYLTQPRLTGESDVYTSGDHLASKKRVPMIAVGETGVVTPSGTLSGATYPQGSVGITFPVGLFDGEPAVVANPVSTSSVMQAVTIGTTTTTGTTLYYKRGNTTGASLKWIAARAATDPT